MLYSCKNDLFALTLILLVVLVFFSGCNDNSHIPPAENGDESKISVAVSINPQKEFVEAIGGEKVSVFVMVPPGLSPHSSELTSGQLQDVSGAGMYVMTGSGIEFELAWMDKIKGLNPDMPITDCSEGVEMINKEGGYGDPHIWLSLKNAKIMCENICDGLISLSPGNEEYFRKNLYAYENKLDDLDQRIKDKLGGREGEIIMVCHPAWSYFARDYSLRQLSIGDDGKEPTPARLKALIDQAEENNIKVIFASPEYSTGSADVIAKAIGGRVILVDPLSEDYILNMESVVRAFTLE